VLSANSAYYSIKRPVLIYFYFLQQAKKLNEIGIIGIAHNADFDDIDHLWVSN